MRPRIAVFPFLVLLLAAPLALQAGDNPQNEGNDPLTPKAALQFLDYFQPFLNGQPGSGANQTSGRAVLPHEAFGIPQLARASLPIASTWGPADAATGLGDLTIFDVAVHAMHGTRFGIGPLLVAPTATSPLLGEGRWQLGGQGVFSARHDWGLAAGLASYRQSFDGQSQTLTLQPLLFYNLPDGYYLRSSGIMSFDFAQRTVAHRHRHRPGDPAARQPAPQLIHRAAVFGYPERRWRADVPGLCWLHHAVSGRPRKALTAFDVQSAQIAFFKSSP